MVDETLNTVVADAKRAVQVCRSARVWACSDDETWGPSLTDSLDFIEAALQSGPETLQRDIIIARNHLRRESEHLRYPPAFLHWVQELDRSLLTLAESSPAINLEGMLRIPSNTARLTPNGRFPGQVGEVRFGLHQIGDANERVAETIRATRPGRYKEQVDIVDFVTSKVRAKLVMAVMLTREKELDLASIAFLIKDISGIVDEFLYTVRPKFAVVTDLLRDESARLRAAAREALAMARSLAQTASQTRGATHVLVVDDNATNRMVMESLCEMFGCTSRSVTGGREALEAISNDSYDLILMDLQMPGMDGFEATQLIRSLPGANARVPIVAVTTNTSTDVVSACRALGMAAVIEKPIKPDKLLGAMNEALSLADEEGAMRIRPQGA